ncbi:MAG: multidrug effflux MFS transporter [Candidatus Eiseniibacteriota bacterium]
MRQAGAGAVGAVVILLVVTPVLGIDLQLPAMPDIARDLGASVGQVQLTLSLYTIAFAVMQLLFGSLGDRHGRRKLILASLALYALASLYCALAPSIGHLTAARILQGIAACGGPVLGRAVVRDLYDPKGAGRVLGTVMACFGIAAIVVPILGGQLVEAFGWRATFFLAAGYGVGLLVLTALILPETLRASAAGTRRVGRLFGDYLILLRTPEFLVIAATGCFIQGAMFTWISGSSFAVIRVLGYSPSIYSLVYAVTVFGFVMTSFASGRVIARLGQRRLIALGGTLALIGAATGLVLNLAVTPSLLTLVAPIFVVAVGHGFTLAQAMAGTMAAFPHLAGTASALFGFLQYLMATVVVAANGVLFDGTVVPLLVISTSCAALAMLCFGLFGRHVKLAGA